MNRRSFLAGGAGFIALPALIAPSRAQTREALARIGSGLRVVGVASGLENPWGMAFLPDGRIAVTERPGRLRIVTPQGALSDPISGVPKVFASGQGGLLDIALAPDHATSRDIFLSFSEGSSGSNGTAVYRGTLSGAALTKGQVIYQQRPRAGGANHFGSRLAFRGDGTLFVTQGDRYGLRDEAQNLRSLIGKVVRINADGSIPQDNPFIGRDDAEPEIWSYGHRNVQGAAIHPATGALWTHEHGARGGDEVNLDEAGRNYGWPVITHGVDYSGVPIGIGEAKEGMEQPLWHWTPSIAPSGMAFCTSDAIPDWKGSLLVGALRGQLLSRLTLDGNRITGEERLLEDLGERIRDVRQGPDGLIYLLTDSDDGKILRIEPVTS
jgi:aldose sugar dehydrogenase